MRIADVQLTFPSILTALLVDGVITAALPRTMRDALQIYVIIFAIGISLWPNFARTVRGSTLVERNKDYVMAARVIGVPSWRIMLTHVLPNVIGPVMVIGTLSLGLAIIAEATLSFLGVGLPPTQPSLGTLIRFGNDFLFSGQWWVTVFPGLTLILMVLAINLLGDWLRDALNPKAALMPLLEVQDLTVEFPTRRGVLRALDRVSFDIDAGEILGVVGESGAGKSLTGAAIVGLLERPGRIAGGEIRLDGQRIDNLAAEPLRRIRGRRIGMIFQDPLTTLNPLYTIGRQLTETMQTHLRAVQRRGAAQGGRLARPRRHSRRRPADRCLPARVLRRPAATRGHRPGVVRRTRAGHRRRADHRAGRFDPGADHYAAEGPDAATTAPR